MARAFGKLTALKIDRLSQAGMFGDGGGLYLQVKHSVSNSSHADEIRAGLTFGFSVTNLGRPSRRER